MNQKDFIEKLHTLLPECRPEAAQLWCEFAAECVDREQHVHFQATESRDASIESWLEVLYEGLRQTRETFGAELAARVAALSLEHCCLYPGEMPRAAECLRSGDGAKDILAKIESGEIDCTNLFSAAPPKESPTKTYMSEQEFTAHMNGLIPTPSAEANSHLLDLANGLWLEMKDDLYHAFSFVSRHFTAETLQNVYDLCGTRETGLLPWEIIGAAVYVQAGTPAEEISKDEWKDFVLLPTPESAGAISSLAICTVRENGEETQFYTPHFGQCDPQKLLDTAIARAGEAGTTAAETLQQMDHNLPEVESHVTANKAILGPGSRLAEKLSLLMPSSPITAAHIIMDADRGSVTIRMNPLWEKLRDERESGPPVQQKHSSRKRSSKHKNQPDR